MPKYLNSFLKPHHPMLVNYIQSSPDKKIPVPCFTSNS
jgi:hypothetical protein